MKIEDEAITLNSKRFKDNDIIATFLTKEFGKFKGFMRSKKKYDAGTFVEAIWSARLEDQLGVVKFEEISRPKILDKTSPFIILAMAEMTDKVLPERDPVPYLFDMAKNLIENPTLEMYAAFERLLLKKSGYSLENYSKEPRTSLQETAKGFIESGIMRSLPTHRALLLRQA